MIAAAKKAGEGSMAGYGVYNLLRSASETLATDNYIKLLPAHEVFVYISRKMLSAMVSYKTDEAYNKIMVAKPKPKGKK